jgi:hypothetical protein
MKNNTKMNEKIFLSRLELGCRWACSRESLKRRERAGILIVHKLDKAVRYKLEDIVAIEEAARVNK